MPDDHMAGDLARRVDGELVQLEDDRRLTARLDEVALSDIDELSSRVSSSYSQALKQLAFGNTDDATSALQEIHERLKASRVRLLQASVERTTIRLSRTVSGPLWMGERVPHLQILGRIQRDLTAFAADDREQLLRTLRSWLDELADIQRQLDADERRTRVRLPLQVLLWGLPILVGFWASDRFTIRDNLAGVGVLVLIVALLYACLRYRILSRFTPLLALRNYARTIKVSTVNTVVPLLAILVGALGMVQFIYNDAYVRSQMELIEPSIAPEALHDIPVALEFQVHNKHSHPATGVLVEFSLLGIVDVQSQRVPVISPGERRTMSFVVCIPPDVPVGTYAYRLRMSYTMRALESVFSADTYKPFVRDTYGTLVVLQSATPGASADAR